MTPVSAGGLLMITGTPAARLPVLTSPAVSNLRRPARLSSRRREPEPAARTGGGPIGRLAWMLTTSRDPLPGTAADRLLRARPGKMPHTPISAR